jgi:exopolysaccharide biosynthesis predicted pyruvyltransferase EpsI
MRVSRNKAIAWGIVAVISTLFTLGLLISYTLDIVAEKFHNEEVIDLERTVWHMEDGEIVKVVTFYTDNSQITVWVRKDSIQVDKLEFE